MRSVKGRMRPGTDWLCEVDRTSGVRDHFLDLVGSFARNGLVDFAYQPLFKLDVIMATHLAEGLWVRNHKHVGNLSGDRFGIEPFSGGSPVSQLIQVGSAMLLPDIVLVLDTGTEIGC